MKRSRGGVRGLSAHLLPEQHEIKQISTSRGLDVRAILNHFRKKILQTMDDDTGFSQEVKLFLMLDSPNYEFLGPSSRTQPIPQLNLAGMFEFCPDPFMHALCELCHIPFLRIMSTDASCLPDGR